ncbi:MAG: hypothetical protein R2873_16865 [Caldilineaceae bacterium]
MASRHTDTSVASAHTGFQGVTTVDVTIAVRGSVLVFTSSTPTLTAGSTMPLQKEEFQQIYDALLEGYDEGNLRRMVRLGPVALDRHHRPGQPRSAHLLNWLSGQTELAENVNSSSKRTNGIRPTSHLQKVYAVWFGGRSSPVSERLLQPDAAAAQIFLSYSRHDSAHMQQVLSLFQQAGLSVWTDDGLEPARSVGRRRLRRPLSAHNVRLCSFLSPCQTVAMGKPRSCYSPGVGATYLPILLHGNKREAVLFGLFDVQYLMRAKI